MRIAKKLANAVAGATLSKQASYAPNLDNLIHYSHSGDGQITPSISRLYDTDPEQANKILAELVAKGHRNPNYMKSRQAIEDYMRSRLSEMGITPGSKYPTYAVLDMGADPKLFAGEKKVLLPLQALRDKVTFTLGDSFPVLTHKIDPDRETPVSPYGRELLTYKAIKQLVNGERLAKRLERMHDVSLARGRKVPMDYVEAQIWEEPEKLLDLLKKGSI